MNFSEIPYIELLPDNIGLSFVPMPCKVCSNETRTYDIDYDVYICSDECYLNFLQDEIDDIEEGTIQP